MARKSTGKRLRFEVFERDGYACRYCGSQPPSVVLVLDHVIPVAADGETTADNLVTACEPCNQGKSSRVLGQFAPAPDADLLYLKTQQEIAELRRYHASVEAKEAQIARVVDSLQQVWLRTSGADWMPSESLINQVLLKYSPRSVETAIRETASRVGSDYFAERNAWIKYLWAVARNADSAQHEQFTDEELGWLEWDEARFFANKRMWVTAYREALQGSPEPAPGSPATDWADREWAAAIAASRMLIRWFLNTLPPEKSS